MKLTKELKSQIDSYFDQISAAELYDVLTYRYHMPDIDDIFNQGEYISYSSCNFGFDIQNYSDISMEDFGSVISEEASRVYREAA